MSDRPVAGGPAGGTEDRRKGLDHDDATVAQKGELNPHLIEHQRIQPDGDPAFLAAMEDLLDTRYLDAIRVRLMRDNLTPHGIDAPR